MGADVVCCVCMREEVGCVAYVCIDVGCVVYTYDEVRYGILYMCVRK